MSLYQRVLVIAGGLLTVGLIHMIAMGTLSHQAKAIFMRGEVIFVFETILTFLSVMIWRTFSPHLKNDTGSPSGDTLRRSKSSDANLLAHSDQRRSGQTGLSFLQMLLIGYLFLSQTSYLTNIYFIAKEPYWFGMLTYSCLGSYIQLVMGILIGKFMSFIVGLLRGTKLGLSKKFVSLLAVSYTLLVSTMGLYVASQPPMLRSVKIPVRDLPSNLEGLVIVQLSDIHLGPTVGFTKLNMIVDMVNNENPDVVVLTGDLVDGTVKNLRSAAEPLSRVTSKYGNFYVTGNHEYYTGDVENWLSFMRSLTFKTLHNSNAKVPAKVTEGQGQICIAGTDDIQADVIGYSGHKFDLTAATKGCAGDQPVILLAHQPKAAKRALDSNNRIDLVLSGHTHGGQIFPMILGAYFLNPFYQGLYEYGSHGSHVYVSEGTQYWGIPMRIATSMEITRITLTRASI